MSNPNQQRDPAQSSPLACIAEQLQCLENVARGRGSPTCDQLAGRLAEVRRDLQRVMGHQPPAAVSEVTRQLIDRDRKGREKYGVTLDRRDLSVSDWLQHMAEELMDAAGYALAAKREAQQPAAFRNDGNSEADFIADDAIACTACGGSGHRDDQQPAAVDGDWRKKAAEWLEAKAVEQEAANQKWPSHAACYKEWRDRPGILRHLAFQVLAGQQGGES